MLAPYSVRRAENGSRKRHAVHVVDPEHYPIILFVCCLKPHLIVIDAVRKHSNIVIADGGKGASWTVPAEDHQPIAQGAILLTRGKDNAAAKGFLDYLRSPEAVAVIETSGYRAGG